MNLLHVSSLVSDFPTLAASKWFFFWCVRRVFHFVNEILCCGCEIDLWFWCLHVNYCTISSWCLYDLLCSAIIFTCVIIVVPYTSIILSCVDYWYLGVVWGIEPFLGFHTIGIKISSLIFGLTSWAWFLTLVVMDIFRYALVPFLDEMLLSQIST